jgi:hypothetical protein
MFGVKAAERDPQAPIIAMRDGPFPDLMSDGFGIHAIDPGISTRLVRIWRIEENGRDSAEVDRRCRPADPAPISTTDTHLP